MKNKNIKNLIVGVDLSDYSKVVAHEAKELSAKMKTPLTVVFVCPIDWASNEYQADLNEELTLKLKTTYDLDEKTKVSIKFGKAEKEIISLAKKIPSPLIMIGYKGYSSAIERMFLGSTAERLAQASPYPVWIHRGSKVVIPKKILIPSDLSDRAKRTLKGVEQVGQLLKAKVELYHVTEEPRRLLADSAWMVVYEHLKKDEQKKLKNFKKKHPGLKTSKTPGNVAANIQDHSKNFDIIAITPSRAKNSFPFFGSVNAKIVRNGETPILVCP